MALNSRWIAVVMGLMASVYFPLAQASSVPVIDESIRISGGENTSPAPAVETQDLSESSEEEESDVPVVTSKRVVTATTATAATSNLSLEQRLTRLEKQVSARGEETTQLEGLHQEIAELRGQIELNTHQIQLLSQKQAVAQASEGSDTAAKGNVAAVREDDASELVAYQKAYDAIKAKDFERAKTAFQAYLHQYSKGTYAGNSHYWLGEIYLHQGALTKASAEFNQVLANAKNTKYPDAMLKMGFVYYQQGAWDQARRQLNQVKQQFPDTTVATLAESKLQEMTQQGH